MIQRRLVFLFPGFEPMRASQHRDRFVRAAHRSAPFWGADITFANGDDGADPNGRSQKPGTDSSFLDLEAHLTGERFETDTRIVICDWGDLILAYGAKPPLVRFLRGYGALGDFLFTGTFFRYCVTSWRYALFFAFPVVVLLCAILAGALFARLATSILPNWAGLAAGVALTATLILLACKRMHLLTALDDWTLARDLCRAKNPALTQRIEAQSAMIRSQATESKADEIVLAAHSLGASLAILALSKGISDGFAPDGRFSILTVGSSFLKTAFHPSATNHLSAVRTIVGDRRLPWIECQALSDVINFYKSNPATSLGVIEGRTPTVVRVHVRRLLSEATYLRVRRDFFRLHRQFVLAVERRAPYSFHMLLLGPLPLSKFAETKTVNHPPLVPETPVPTGEVVAK